MTFKTQSKKDSAEKTAYKAIDAIQTLCDNGHGCYETEKAFEAVRALVNKIQSAEISK